MISDNNVQVEEITSTCKSCKYASKSVSGGLICSMKAKAVDPLDCCSYWAEREIRKPKKKIVLGEYSI
jgi:hypothetical protein